MDVLAQSRRRRLYEPVLVWQWPIRIFHWVFASAITVLFVTGIYITHPISNATGEAGGLSRMATVRTIHFTAAAVFTIAFFWRVAWFFLGNRYARSGFPQLWLPSWWRSFLRQAWNYLRHDYRDVHLGHNALAGLSYVIVPVLGGAFMMGTGFAMYGESNPGGFWDSLCGWIRPLLGGSFRTHTAHHLVAWFFLVFVIVHVYLVLMNGTQQKNGLISSMISGRKFRRIEDSQRTENDDGQGA